MTARKPWRDTEPLCPHSAIDGVRVQPMSACTSCEHSPDLKQWRAEWAAWLAENPDSWEAVFVRAMKRCGTLPAEHNTSATYPCWDCEKASRHETTEETAR